MLVRNNIGSYTVVSQASVLACLFAFGTSSKRNESNVYGLRCSTLTGDSCAAKVLESPMTWPIRLSCKHSRYSESTLHGGVGKFVGVGLFLFNAMPQALNTQGFRLQAVLSVELVGSCKGLRRDLPGFGAS